MKRVWLVVSWVITSSLFLSGCAGTNTIHNLRRSYLNSQALHNNSFKEIKQVKMHANGDLEICVVGNQIKDNSEFTISIKSDIDPSLDGALTNQDDDNNLIYKMDSKMWHLGCNLSLLEDDTLLTLPVHDAQPIANLTRWPVSGVPTWIEYDNRAYFENLSYYHRHPVAWVTFNFGDAHIKEINTPWVLTIYTTYKKSNKSYNTAAKPSWEMYDYDKQDHVVRRDINYYIEPKLPKGFEESHSDYEVIGNIFDVVTSPIQILLCFISWGHACSDSPHPYIGNMVPG